MQPLDMFLPQPACDLSPEKQADFEALIEATPRGAFINYRLTQPKWQFLDFICKTRHLVLHGSQHADIEEVQPRKAADVRAFSKQQAIYATTDGIWAIYFAIIDRQNVQPLSLFNSCITVRTAPDHVLGPLYFFSITHSALLRKPWCDGVIYILPRADFEQEPPQHMHGAEVTFPHWIGFKPTRPLAKLRVQPRDFPYLDQIHGHDDEKLRQGFTADPNGFPWPEALLS